MQTDDAQSYDVELLPQAIGDIEEEVVYVSKVTGSCSSGERLVARIAEAAESLRNFPYGRPVYRPLRNVSHEMRWLLEGRWYLFYWIEEERQTVVVARVIYARRNLEEIDIADLYPHLG